MHNTAVFICWCINTLKTHYKIENTCNNNNSSEADPEIFGQGGGGGGGEHNHLNWQAPQKNQLSHQLKKVPDILAKKGSLPKKRGCAPLPLPYLPTLKPKK